MARRRIAKGVATEHSYAAFDAKNSLGELLDRVSRGQEITITRHGIEIARVVPIERGKTLQAEAILKLIQLAGKIFPLEVKAGATGRLKSLRIFLDSHAAPFGIRISAHPLSFHDQVLSVPFYLIDSLTRLTRETMDR